MPTATAGKGALAEAAYAPAGFPLQNPSILTLLRTSHRVTSSLPAAASSSGRDACMARAEHRRAVEPRRTWCSSWGGGAGGAAGQLGERVGGKAERPEPREEGAR